MQTTRIHPPKSAIRKELKDLQCFQTLKESSEHSEANERRQLSS